MARCATAQAELQPTFGDQVSGRRALGHVERVLTNGSSTRSASDAYAQSIELAIAAEEVGADGAYFRVHHFAEQLTAPFPLLAAVAARTTRIELGTGVIDMRYDSSSGARLERSVGDVTFFGALNAVRAFRMALESCWAQP